MAEYLKWDADTKRFYETGTSHGVLYVKGTNGYEEGVAWNGLTAFSESPSGAEETELYANDHKYGSLRSAEKFGGTIEAYTYPEEFEKCDGSFEVATGVTIGQQPRNAFGFTYRTVVGNDVSDDYGYKIHIVWNASVSPSEKSYASINDSPEAITFSWELSTSPTEVEMPDGTKKYTASMVIDSTKLTGNTANANLKELEKVLYGVEGVEANAQANPPIEAVTEVKPSLPTPNRVIEIMSATQSSQ